MHRLLFICKLLFLYMFRAINTHLQEDTLHTCSIWYCHSLRELMVASRYSENSSCEFSLKLCTDWPPWALVREWQYHTLHVYNVSSWRWAFIARNMQRN